MEFASVVSVVGIAVAGVAAEVAGAGAATVIGSLTVVSVARDSV